MLKTSSLVWLLSILIGTENFALSEGILVEKWIEQYQDHFDYYNHNTWLMRYYENDEFYHQSGPIFIMITGERALVPDYVRDTTSFMYEMARAYGAMMYSPEHRYYGRSHPVPDTSPMNLRYLSVPQVLADIALFIEIKKSELNISDPFVMVFGSSYAGNLAAWMRVEYPNSVHGALASSAPIYSKVDFFEFHQFIGNSIRKYDEKCAANIKKAFSTLEELLTSPDTNLFTLKNDFKLCSRPDPSQPSEISLMMSTLASIFSGAVIANKIEINGKTSVENLCMFMGEHDNKSSHYGLAEVLKKKFFNKNSCIDLKYKRMVEYYLQTSWEYEGVTDRLWIYQTCKELGYFATSSSPESIFGSLFPLQYFTDRCKDLFTEIANIDNLNYNIRRINHSYTSKLSNTTNIIFTNGDRDPWSSLSVLSDLNTDSPAILINGASHGGFLTEHKATQPDSLIIARCQVSLMIYEWLYTHKNLYG